jgi:UDP-N-acetylglucosamine 2-epimerase
VSEIRILSVVGARPQFVKLAPVERALQAHAKADGAALRSLIVHTGQHYDYSLSRVFFEELSIPEPAVNLAIGSGSHGEQTGRMLEQIERVLLEQRPHAVVVYGDTNSTVAGALAATKLGIAVAHVEAGLRSFDRRMPEELNRIATDHLADLLLAPTSAAVENLRREGLFERTIRSGDVMYDAVLFNADIAAKQSPIDSKLGLGNADYGLVTIHRAQNTEPQNLRRLLDLLNAAAARLPLIFPVHPRTAQVMHDQLGDWRAAPDLRVVTPLSYLEMLAAVRNARCVLTDSGGLQKEAAFLSCPCLTLRDETEWVETVEIGANVLVGAQGQELLGAFERTLNGDRPNIKAAVDDAYGSGRASEVVARAVLRLARDTRSAEPAG